MSTPAAAAESAAPAVVDPGAVADAGSEAGDAPADEAPDFGTIADIREALGLTDDEAADVADVDSTDPGKKTVKTEAKKPETDEDAAAILAINKRSEAHRRARREAQRAEQAKAVTPAPAAAAPKTEPPKVEAKPEPKPTTQPESEAKKAAKQVLDMIATLAGDDEAAAAATADPTAKQTAERQTLVDSIKAQLETLGTAAKEAASVEAKALKAEIDGLKTQLGAIESTRVVRDHIESKVETIVDELPTLMGKRNATDILHKAAGKFFDKYKKFPDVQELARRIEAKLSAEKPPEKTEKRPQTRKTVSNSLGSPPAARTGPDLRTAEQAEADFNARFGLDR